MSKVREQVDEMRIEVEEGWMRGQEDHRTSEGIER